MSLSSPGWSVSRAFPKAVLLSGHLLSCRACSAETMGGTPNRPLTAITVSPLTGLAHRASLPATARTVTPAMKHVRRVAGGGY